MARLPTLIKVTVSFEPGGSRAHHLFRTLAAASAVPAWTIDGRGRGRSVWQPKGVAEHNVSMACFHYFRSKDSQTLCTSVDTSIIPSMILNAAT